MEGKWMSHATTSASMGSWAPVLPTLLGLHLLLLLPSIHATAPSPAPPFQWIQLTSLLNGTGPPPLKNAAMGYDETSRTLLIFGGEASSGVPQASTYLLDLQTLTWKTPSPPSNLQAAPAARSSAVFGVDIAASNRNGFLVVGGQGQNGPLDDVVEFDFVNQFWSQVGISNKGPSARSGAVGGIDPRIPGVSDPVLPGPNNTFWLWGGSDGTTSFSELWRLNVSGTLSSNLPNSAVGSWEQISVANLPTAIGQGGSVLSSTTSSQIVASGGCNATTTPAESCALQATYIINGVSAADATALDCPAPRLSPVIIPNGNAFSESFASQMLLLLGTFNSSFWYDGDGLKDGEVAVLDTSTQSWTRILPAGDPGTTGVETFPSARAGAVAIMSPLALVGAARSTSSDIIVFGGENEDGEYLAEMWLLRAYNAVTTASQPTWSGSGGKLETGINASGSGVKNTFLTTCAAALTPTLSTPTNTSSSSPTSSNVSPHPSMTSHFDVSIVHKSLAPVSAALLLPSFLMYRHSSRTFSSSGHLPLLYLALALAAFAYGLGIAALATAFTSSTSRHLNTAHGRAGLALFICLYGLAALLLILASAKRPRSSHSEPRSRADSDASEKDRLSPMAHSPSPTASMQRRWRKDSVSFDGASTETGDWLQSAPPKRTFEVLNRPARTRRASSSRQAMLSEDTSPTQVSQTQSLSDAEWLNRRRSLTIVGELEHARASPAPAATLPPSTPATLLDPPTPLIPPMTTAFARGLLHALLLGFCVFTLIALWSMAPKGAFAGFLVATCLFYLSLVGLAWKGQPDRSIFTIMLRRLRTEPQTPAAPRTSVSETLPEHEDGPAFPYAHRPPVFRTPGTAGAQSTSSGPDDDDEDDTRAEAEMRNRDVSIWTSQPKRALVITNL
uniref:Galactose oxidase n=1 Tax=Mycena chlorophos TaxID=658473 RepID=A0ABQ0M839_MYCCL|nr:predicted protein [Mycena chlorophos]